MYGLRAGSTAKQPPAWGCSVPQGNVSCPGMCVRRKLVVDESRDVPNPEEFLEGSPVSSADGEDPWEDNAGGGAAEFARARRRSQAALQQQRQRVSAGDMGALLDSAGDSAPQWETCGEQTAVQRYGGAAHSACCLGSSYCVALSTPRLVLISPEPPSGHSPRCLDSSYCVVFTA